jgi:palmitoyl-protein thioesterase
VSIYIQAFFLLYSTPLAGVSDIPNCMNPRDFRCKLMRSMVRTGVYSDYIQNRIVQAQYYRDPTNEEGIFDL